MIQSKLRGRKIVKEKAGFAALSDAAKQAALDAADEEAMVRRRQKQQDVDSKRNAILDDEAVLLKAVDDEEKKEKLALLENVSTFVFMHHWIYHWDGGLIICRIGKGQKARS